jgi:HEAT repeat protein
VDQHSARRSSRPAARKIRMQDLLAELTSGDDVRAENSVTAIVELGMAVMPALLDLTRAEETDSRWWAVRALAASPHTRTDDLIPLLSDSAPEVRAAAALALCNHPHESAVEALVKTLADEDSVTAGLAGNALAKIGSPSVLSLIRAAQEASTGIRARIVALRALSEIRDHRAIPVMMKVLSEESALLQYWAQEGLDRLGLNMVYIKP